nr:EOG090X0D34 [Triops cancriformis]
MATGFSFGTSFGQQSGTPATGFGAAPTGIAFGTPASSAAPSLFGGMSVPSSISSTGFGTSTFGFGAGNPISTAAPSFGLGATPASTGSLFGVGATPAFGATSSAPSAFGFGNTQTTSVGSGFGLPTVPTSVAGFGGFGTMSSAAPTFGFGSATTTSSAPSFGFGTAASTQPTSLFGALGAGAGTSTAPSFGLGGVSSASLGLSTTTVSTGLGGVSAASLAVTSAHGKPDVKAIKETTVPAEIVQNVEDYKNFLKEQKAMREGIARASSKPLLKIQEEVDGLKQLLSALAMGIQKNCMLLEKLKKDVELELQNAEMAQKTKDTPLGLQLEHTAPNEYFARLVVDFENRSLMYKHYIEEMERNLSAVARNEALTPEELVQMLKKVHEAFIALAGRLYTVHEAVREQKTKFVQRRRELGDSSDIFTDKTQNKGLGVFSKPRRLAGPSPFGDGNDVLTRTMANLASATHYNNPTTLTSSNPGTKLLNDTLSSSFALDGDELMVLLYFVDSVNALGLRHLNSSTGLGGGVSTPVDNGSFTLRSPPSGTKRGKR